MGSRVHLGRLAVPETSINPTPDGHQLTYSIITILGILYQCRAASRSSSSNAIVLRKMQWREGAHLINHGSRWPPSPTTRELPSAVQVRPRWRSAHIPSTMRTCNYFEVQSSSRSTWHMPHLKPKCHCLVPVFSPQNWMSCPAQSLAASGFCFPT